MSGKRVESDQNVDDWTNFDEKNVQFYKIIESQQLNFNNNFYN